MMRIDGGSSEPIYQQIVSQMQSKIAAGVYREGERIPSARELAKEITVNPNTVQKAYAELAEMGVIETRRGLGKFVSRRGTHSAIQQSEDAILALFQQAFSIGTIANLPQKRMKKLFKDAMDSAGKSRRTA